MACTLLTKEEQNFIRFVKACDDGMPLPLRDILDFQIKPTDLYTQIQSCATLTTKEKRLDSHQMCQIKQADYSNFDVTLLYKLIRNLCPGLKPTLGWGMMPSVNHIDIGDDIERIRVFRNELGHSKSSNIPDIEFKTRWTELHDVIKRLQKVMSKNGYKTDYKEKLRSIEELNLGDEPREKYKMFLILEFAFNHLQLANDREEPAVSIAGNENVMCGENAIFEAEVTYSTPSFWTHIWQKTRDHVTENIDINKKKFSGSTDRRLVITSVSKEDEWIYQAVLSRETNGNKQKIISNGILLHVLGEKPRFDVWKVTTDMDGITIHYALEDNQPTVYKIKWTKNDKLLDFNDTKYVGGSLEDRYLRITSPNETDGAKYCCAITNAVGSASKDVTFDIPKANISSETGSYYGMCVSISSQVISCPAPEGAQWQKSIDGITLYGIDIGEAKYYGSNLDPESPSLEIKPISFEDKQHYRLRVWNKIGEGVSNTVYLNVIGSRPNVTISHNTCIKNHSITLIGNVFLYEECLDIQNLFWSRNGKKLEPHLNGGKYLEVGKSDPSLTIFDINQHDAGSYQLTATNAVGTTQSNVIALGDPDIFMDKSVKEENGRWWFTVTIQSIPSPCFVQWSMRKQNSDSFKVIDINAEEYKGTSNTLPHPVLVIKQSELQTHCFRLEVQNFIGNCEKTIQGDINLGILLSDNRNSRTLSKVFSDRGSKVMFANLFDQIAEGFPKDQIRRLQDLIYNSHKVDNKESLRTLYETNSARDCFRILRDEELFTSENVIFVQYLLKTAYCEDLNAKCVEYARRQNALCFYEGPAENGFKNVKFHVEGNISDYSKEDIKKIKDTVAVILKCTADDISISGICQATSFFVVISIKAKYKRNLLSLVASDREKICRLNIDYFIVDSTFVRLTRGKETDWLSQPQVKQTAQNVSKAYKCLQKLETIQEDEEYGWATFRCVCGNEFSGHVHVNVTRKECYTCHSMVLAVSILPPEKRKTWKFQDLQSMCSVDGTYRKYPKETKNRAIERKGHKECISSTTRPYELFHASGRRRVILSNIPHQSYHSTDIDPKGTDVFRPVDIPCALAVQLNPNRGFHMDTTATQKVYPVNEMIEMETKNKEEESSDMIWRDLTTIYPDHKFDEEMRTRCKQKRKSTTVSKPDEPGRGCLPVRQFHKSDETKILPHVRRGLKLDD